MLETKDYNNKVDVYSYGVMLWEMWTRVDAWTNVVVWDIPKNVIGGNRPEIPDDCPDEYAGLIIECWSQDFNHRPEFVTIAERIHGILEEENEDKKHHHKHKHHHGKKHEKDGDIEMDTLEIGAQAGEEPPMRLSQTVHVPAIAIPRERTSSGLDKSPRRSSIVARSKRSTSSSGQNISSEKSPRSDVVDTAAALGFKETSIISVRKGSTLVTDPGQQAPKSPRSPRKMGGSTPPPITSQYLSP